MPVSNSDLIWTEEQAKAALAEGWALAWTVNEGKPISTAYLEIFDVGPKFRNRNAAVHFVQQVAYTNSKLHIAAISACAATRGWKPTKGKR